jgi:phage-related protein (TIGR01555 family)
MDTIRNDGTLLNVLTEMGTESDKSEHTRVGVTSRMGKGELEELYKNSLCQRVCRARPDAAIAKGWQLTLGEENDPKLLSQFNKYCDRLGVTESFNDAQVWANLYRGAVIILGIDDGLPPSEPVREDKIKTIKFIEVIDCHKIRPYTVNIWNPTKPEYYQLILPANLQGNLTNFLPQGQAIYKIHASRIIRFDGVLYSPDMMMREDGWGGSILEAIWQEFRDYKSGLTSVGSMLNDFSLFIYSIKGLSDMVRSNDQDSLKARFRLFHTMVSTFKGVALDAEGEKIDYAARNFAGVDAVLEKLKDAFIAATGMPHTVLFGDGPAGFQSTGEGEENAWAADVENYQKTKWLPKLKIICKYILLAKDGPTKGKEPEDWNPKFNPLVQQSQTDIISDRNAQSQIDNTYFSMGALLLEEIRDSRFAGADYSFETRLNKSLWDKKQKEAQALQEQQNSGFDDYSEEPEETEAEPKQDSIAEKLPKEQFKQDGCGCNADDAYRSGAFALVPEEKQQLSVLSLNPAIAKTTLRAIMQDKFPEKILGINDDWQMIGGGISGSFTSKLGVYGFKFQPTYWGYGWRQPLPLDPYEAAKVEVLDSLAGAPSGFHYVIDPRVKGGKYLRKNPKGGNHFIASTHSPRAANHSHYASLIGGGLALAGVAMGVWASNQGISQKVEGAKTAANQNIGHLRSQVESELKTKFDQEKEVAIATAKTEVKSQLESEFNVVKASIHHESEQKLAQVRTQLESELNAVKSKTDETIQSQVEEYKAKVDAETTSKFKDSEDKIREELKAAAETEVASRVKAETGKLKDSLRSHLAEHKAQLEAKYQHLAKDEAQKTVESQLAEYKTQLDADHATKVKAAEESIRSQVQSESEAQLAQKLKAESTKIKSAATKELNQHKAKLQKESQQLVLEEELKHKARLEELRSQYQSDANKQIKAAEEKFKQQADTEVATRTQLAVEKKTQELEQKYQQQLEERTAQITQEAHAKAQEQIVKERELTLKSAQEKILDETQPKAHQKGNLVATDAGIHLSASARQGLNLELIPGNEDELKRNVQSRIDRAVTSFVQRKQDEGYQELAVKFREHTKEISRPPAIAQTRGQAQRQTEAQWQKLTLALQKQSNREASLEISMDELRTEAIKSYRDLFNQVSAQAIKEGGYSSEILAKFDKRSTELHKQLSRKAAATVKDLTEGDHPQKF